MKFSSDILGSVDILRQVYNTGKNVIRVEYPVIEVSLYTKDRETSVVLIYDSVDGTFELQEPVYRYFSKVSFYDFKRPEKRWTRNKGFLFSLIRNLKRSNLWEKISNKDFLVVNKSNTETDYTDRLKVLQKVKTLVPGITSTRKSTNG